MKISSNIRYLIGAMASGWQLLSRPGAKYSGRVGTHTLERGGRSQAVNRKTFTAVEWRGFIRVGSERDGVITYELTAEGRREVLGEE